MKYFPEYVLLKDQKVLIAGGGHAAWQKVRALHPFGARLVLVSPSFNRELQEDSSLTLIEQEFEEELLEGAAMVIAATDDVELNHRIARLAAKRKIPCNCVDDQEWCSFIFPALVEDEDLVIGISTGGSSPSVARWLKKQIRSELPEGFGLLLKWLASIREPVKEEFSDQHERSRVFRTLFETCMALGRPLSEEEFRDLLVGFKEKEPADREGRMIPGEVVLAGAGCGSSKLLTQEVRSLLLQAPVVVYDDLVDDSILALADSARKIYVGKRGGRLSMKQPEINELLLQLAREYPMVLRLKGGDPFVFGRGMEEMQFLQDHGISVRECSGIPSFLQVPARFGIPLTHRGLADRFLVMTGTNARENVQPDKWKNLGSFDGSLLILMGLHNLETITKDLMEGGMDPARPSAVLSSETISMSRGCFAPLAQLAEKARAMNMVSPAIVMISNTVALAPEWNEQQEQRTPVYFVSSTGFMKKVERSLPASLFCQSALVLHQKDDLQAVVRAVKAAAGQTGILCLTSPHGAELFLRTFLEEGNDLRSLAFQKICVIGSGTAEVFKKAGMYPDLQPEIFSTVRLAETILEKLPGDLPVLSLRSAEGDNRMEEILKQSHPLNRINLYSTRFEPVLTPEQIDQKPGLLVFGSRGCIQGWKKAWNRLPKQGDFVVLSRECAEELQNAFPQEDLKERNWISPSPAAAQTAGCIEQAAKKLHQKQN